ncbi:MAG: NAD(P)-dependent oxidoreductase [Candidatus Shapirobacteria bacterium]|jgi:phosphoglycerate dehydrogenase-like enzyme
MKIYLLSPVASQMFSSEMVSDLKNVGEVIINDVIKPISEVEAMTDSTDKIIALDPDFCAWNLPKEELEKINGLKALCVQSTSFSWLDTEFLKSKNIPVINIRNYSTDSVAEWAVIMAMNVARKLPLIIKNNWTGDFSLHQGMELKGKTVGIIGLGHIGARIAEICQGMGMNVIYWSKNSVASQYQKVELIDLFKTADLIFPCLAQNEETKNYITDEMLNSMKNTAIFISIVHKIYNHDLLLQLAKENKIYGYAFETPNKEMLNFEGNVWAGPEQAWNTKESLGRNLKIWQENIIKATQNNFEFRVN